MRGPVTASTRLPRLVQTPVVAFAAVLYQSARECNAVCIGYPQQGAPPWPRE